MGKRGEQKQMEWRQMPQDDRMSPDDRGRTPHTVSHTALPESGVLSAGI